MSKKNHYIGMMAEINRKVAAARKAGEKTVEYDLTPFYDEIVTDDCESAKSARKHERQVEKFDDVVETVTHDLRSLGFEVEEEGCRLTIKSVPGRQAI